MNKLKIIRENVEKNVWISVSREDNHFYPACYLNGGPPCCHSGQTIKRGFSRKKAEQLAKDIMEVSRSITSIIVRKVDDTWKLTMYEYPIDSIVERSGKSIKGPHYDENGETEEWLAVKQPKSFEGEAIRESSKS